MTRINSAIPVERLCDQHLMAEHREIKRIPNVIKSGRYNLKGIPNKFVLGTGHVKFFYNKLAFLHNRYEALYLECLDRGFNVTDYSECFIDVPLELYKDYNPTSNEFNLLVDRITDRLYGMKSIRYKGKPVTSNFAKTILLD